MLQTYSFTVADVITIGDAAEALSTRIGERPPPPGSVIRRIGVSTTWASSDSCPPRCRRTFRQLRRGPDATRVQPVDVFRSGVRDATTFTLDKPFSTGPSSTAIASPLSYGRSRSRSAGKHVTGHLTTQPSRGAPFPAARRPARSGAGIWLRDVFTVLDAHSDAREAGLLQEPGKDPPTDSRSSGWPGCCRGRDVHEPPLTAGMSSTGSCCSRTWRLWSREGKLD